jgi:hypothetical protein
MKKLTLLSVLGSVALLALSGCGTVGKIASLTTRPASQSVETVTNTVVQTNIVTATNLVQERIRTPDGTVTTNFVPQIVLVTNQIPVTVIELHTNAVYQTKEAITTGIQVGKTVASFLPAPFGGAATAILGLLTAGLGALAASKNKQANSLNDQLAAVVHGVEQATSAIDPAIGAKVKDTIAHTSRVLGVADQLDDTVQKLTS